MRVSTKTTLSIVGLVSGVLITTLAVCQRALHTQMADSIREDRERSVGVLRSYFDDHHERLDLGLRFVVGAPDFLATLSIPQVDRGTLSFCLDQFRDLLGTDLLVLADADGGVRAAAGPGAADDGGTESIEEIEPTEDRGAWSRAPIDESRTLWHVDGRTYICSTTEIRSGTETLGQIVAGVELGDDAARQLALLLAHDVVVFRAGEPFASSAEWTETVDLASALEHEGDAGYAIDNSFEHGGDRWIALSFGGETAGASDPSVRLVSLANLDKTVGAFLALERLLLQVFIVSLLASVIAGRLLANAIVRPLQQVATGMSEIARGSGDLTAELPVRGDDEIAQLADAFNTFVAKIHSVVSEVAAVSNELTRTMEHIARSSGAITESMQLQTSESQAIVRAVQQLTSASSDAAHRCSRASSDSAQADQLAQEGGRVVADTVAGVRALHDSVRDSADCATKLAQGALEVQEITRLIDSIASQTQLLALNATIESARAGEAGRGFAVVASEVKALASETSVSSADIAQKITDMRSLTGQMAELMTAGAASAEQGLSFATRAGGSLESIVASVTNVASIIEGIAGTMSEQSTSTQEISDRLASIQRRSEEMRSRVEESSREAESLLASSQRLNGLVASFNVGT